MNSYNYVNVFQITIGGLCFGIETARRFGCRTQVVVNAAPVAKWCKGGKEIDILAYWKGRGAKINKLQ